jgi:hypothetical protein
MPGVYNQNGMENTPRRRNNRGRRINMVRLSPIAIAIQFISFIGGLALLPSISKFLITYIANPNLLWISSRAVAFILIIFVFPQILIKIYESRGKE